MSPSLTAFARGTRPFIEAAERLVTAFTPSTWTRVVQQQATQRLWAEARQILPRFVLLSGLLSLALVHIVVTTSDNYGLSGFALATVMRLLVVELLPLLAAVNVALVPPTRGAGAPQVISRSLLVIVMATLSSVLALIIAYLSMYGFNPWGLGIYTHTVGQVFEPIVLIALAMKTLLFAMTVATLNSAALTFGALLGIEILLLVIEFL